MAGLATAFGSGAMTNSINELLNTDVIIVMGSNTTETHPVIGYRIKQAAKKGAKLIVIDPREIDLVKYADLWLPLKPTTNIALLNGFGHVIIRDNLWNKEFVSERTENFNKWKESLQDYTPERVSEITGIPTEDIIKAAHIYAEADKASICYAMGVTQHSSGTNGVFAIANLALSTGNVGREGTGVNPLRGQNNVQGACDMGCLPNYFSCYQHIEDEKTRAKFENAWNTKLPAEPGYTILEMIEKAADNQINGMYIMGENPLLSDPDINHVREGLEELEFLVVQDIFLTETAELADVVLPAACFAEKEGTFTNTERRIQRVRKAIIPPGNAKPDWQILQKVANSFGAGWNYKNPENIMQEIASLSPMYGGINYSKIEKEGVQWPCPTEGHPGTKFLHECEFSSGKGLFRAVEYIHPAEEPDANYPFMLMTGRSLYQFHTGTMSRRSKSLNWIHPEELMEMDPDDAKKLNLVDGDLAEVESRRGKITTRIKLSRKIPDGSIWMTFHFKESAANILTNTAVDPICRIPELKAAAIRIKKIDDKPREKAKYKH